MKKTLNVERKDCMIGLATDIVYMQKNYWCHCSARQLKLSFMRPRHHYSHDPKGTYPLLVFVCGGAWQKMDRNVWLPNLVYFAEHGYAVASIDYSTLPDTTYDERITELKTAIRFLRENAKDFSISKERIAIMGESAGAYLAGLVALTGDDPQYKNAYFPAQSDSVQTAVLWYSPTGLQLMDNSKLVIRTDNFPDLCDLVTGEAPPFLILHGMKDHTVPCSQGERLYEQLERHGIASDLYLLEGAGHGDGLFVQSSMKQLMCSFMDSHLK